MTPVSDDIAADWLSLDFSGMLLDGSFWADRWSRHLNIQSYVDWTAALIQGREAGYVRFPDLNRAILVTTGPGWDEKVYQLPARDLSALHLHINLAELRGESLGIVLFYSSHTQKYVFGQVISDKPGDGR